MGIGNEGLNIATEIELTKKLVIRRAFFALADKRRSLADKGESLADNSRSLADKSLELAGKTPNFDFGISFFYEKVSYYIDSFSSFFKS
jgi:hypothetical protein